MTEPQIVSALISPEDSKLMIEPKRSCKSCYGRGVQMWLEGNGYHMAKKSLVTEAGNVRQYEQYEANPKRISKPCHCVFRNAKFRLNAR